MFMFKKLTDEMLATIKLLRESEELSLDQIKERTGLSKGTVSRAFAVLGITKMQRKDNPTRARRAATLAQQATAPMVRTHIAGSKQLGDAAEAVILAELLKAGKTVLLPFGDRERYDMVVHSGDRFLRVQCKAAWPDSNRPHVVRFKIGYLQGRRNPECHTYTAADIDGIAVWVQAFNQVLWIPVARLEDRSESMLINFDATAKGLWKVNSPEDFPFEVLLNT